MSEATMAKAFHTALQNLLTNAGVNLPGGKNRSAHRKAKRPSKSKARSHKPTRKASKRGKR